MWPFRYGIACLGVACGSSPTAIIGEPAIVFVSDSSAVYRFEDRNNDAIYDHQERTEFFTAAASPTGLNSATGLLALSGTTLLVTNNSRLNETIPAVNNILRLEDLDGDGAALSVGENQVWFSGFIADGSKIAPISSLTRGADGAVHAAVRGYDSTMPDQIYRFFDLTGDGDVDDAGEVTLVTNIEGLAGDIAIDSTAAYWYVSAIEPPTRYGLFKHESGTTTLVVDTDSLVGESLRLVSSGIDLLNDAPVFSVGNQENPVRGTLATLRGTELAMIWTGPSSELSTDFHDFRVLEDGSIIAVRVATDLYRGPLHRFVDGNGDGDFLDSGEAMRVHDPREAEANGLPQLRSPAAVSGSVR